MSIDLKLKEDRKNRVYIAGQMTGIPEYNFPAFNEAAAKLRNSGFIVVNPAEHGIIDGAEWGDYLRYDIGGLVTCERMHLLKGYETSKGVALELTIANTLGIPITYA